MTATTTHSRLDAVGVMLSALCLLHCLALPLLATGALTWVASERVHLSLTVALAIVVLLVAMPGYQRHRRAVVPVFLLSGLALLIAAVVAGERITEMGETAMTALGSMTLIVGHVLNLRRCRATP